jgi:hypothetical protein
MGDLKSPTTNDMGKNIDDEHYESVRVLMSQLRKAMTDDLLSGNRM